jgi:hypothetical protein
LIFTCFLLLTISYLINFPSLETQSKACYFGFFIFVLYEHSHSLSLADLFEGYSIDLLSPWWIQWVVLRILSVCFHNYNLFLHLIAPIRSTSLLKYMTFRWFHPSFTILVIIYITDGTTLFYSQFVWFFDHLPNQLLNSCFLAP